MTGQNYGLIQSLTELDQYLDRITPGDGPIAIDIESGYLGPDREKASVRAELGMVVGISFTDSPTWARYVPLNHDAGANLDNREVARRLWPLFISGRIIAHNIGFELKFLSRWFRQHLADDPEYGDAVRARNGVWPVRSCTQIEAYLAAERESYGLKPLVKAMYGHQMMDLYELFEMFMDLPVNRRRFLRFNVLDQHHPEVWSYACEDAAWCLRIHRDYHPFVSQMPLYPVEMAIVQECLLDMETFGICYDWPGMRRAADELAVFRDKFNGEIMETLSEMLGEPTAINLASPPQLQKLLFERLGYRTTVYTAKTRELPASERKMSTGKVAMAGLANKHPIVARIRHWKEMTRLLGTYLQKYETLYQWADDGMVHPNHLNAFVITGRFAVSDPPYQQSPKRYHFDLAAGARAHEEGREPPPGTCFKYNFRDAVVAPSDYYIVGFDLSQAELRAIAGEAKEPELLKAFAEGRDVHSLTASLMLGVPLEEVTPKQRDSGKLLGFALLYGLSPKGLADRLGITAEEAEDLFAKYFAVYSRIKAWVDKQVRFGRTNGYVTSRFGRRLPIWDYASDKRYIRQRGDRQAVNFPIQGAATGDYMRIAMVRAVRALKKAGLSDRVRLVMNVHDALEFYTHRSVSPQQVIEVLEPAVIFPVPGWPAMKADWHFGRRWGSPIDIEFIDGQVHIKGEKPAEVKPGVEENEDGEEEEILPDVTAEEVREVFATPAATAGRHLLIELTEMPSEHGYRRFRDLHANVPGPNTVTIRTAEGDIDLAGTSGLGPDLLASVSLLLGPVTMSFDADDALETMLDDLRL